MTYERYIELALQFIVAVLGQHRIPFLDASQEQAWNAFLVVFARTPDSLLVQNYFQYGVRFHSDFCNIWQTFQSKCLRNVQAQWQR